MISPVIVALDSFADKRSVMDFVNKLDPNLCELKIGKNVFTTFGPDLVRELIQKKFRIFLDLKFHDIPNTVADACTAAAKLDVWMVNIHVSGGAEMMRAARKAIDAFPSKKKPSSRLVNTVTPINNGFFFGGNASIALRAAHIISAPPDTCMFTIHTPNSAAAEHASATVLGIS